jgi:ubiquinone/menaquinone biosynthesis C-methylase UbiE
MNMDWLSHWYRLCYALWSPFYDLMVQGFAGWRRRSLKLADIQPGERVLIVGAGTGLDLQFIDPGPRISAIDVTKAMLRRLRRRARRRGLTVDAQVMDGQAMDFADGSFDVVILHLILAVIPDPVRCARESARVLRPGGRIVIMDKFVADDRRPPLVLRLVNPLLKALGTNINRKLGPILEGTGLRNVRQEPASLGGFFKIVLLRKD